MSNNCLFGVMYYYCIYLRLQCHDDWQCLTRNCLRRAAGLCRKLNADLPRFCFTTPLPGHSFPYQPLCPRCSAGRLSIVRRSFHQHRSDTKLAALDQHTLENDHKIDRRFSFDSNLRCTLLVIQLFVNFLARKKYPPCRREQRAGSAET